MNIKKGITLVMKINPQRKADTCNKIKLELYQYLHPNILLRINATEDHFHHRSSDLDSNGLM